MRKKKEKAEEKKREKEEKCKRNRSEEEEKKKRRRREEEEKKKRRRREEEEKKKRRRREEEEKKKRRRRKEEEKKKRRRRQEEKMYSTFVEAALRPVDEGLRYLRRDLKEGEISGQVGTCESRKLQNARARHSANLEESGREQEWVMWRTYAVFHGTLRLAYIWNAVFLATSIALWSTSESRAAVVVSVLITLYTVHGVFFTAFSLKVTQAVSQRLQQTGNFTWVFYVHVNAPTWCSKIGFGSQIIPTRRTVEALPASETAPAGPVLPSALHDADGEAVRKKFQEEKREEGETEAMGHEDARGRLFQQQPNNPVLDPSAAASSSAAPPAVQPQEEEEELDMSFLNDMVPQEDWSGLSAPVTPATLP
eukprot:s3391_g1.t1